MAEANPQPQLRRRRSSGNPNLPLNLEVGFKIDEGGPSQGTPSPSSQASQDPRRSAALLEFRKKQQSFDIQIEECEEEDLVMDSEEEGETDTEEQPAVTPTPIQDFGASVTYSDAQQCGNFLQVTSCQTDCVTDVSEAGSDDEE